LDGVDARGADLTGWTLQNVRMHNAEIDGLKAGKSAFFSNVELDGSSGANVDVSGLEGSNLSLKNVKIDGFAANGSLLYESDLDGFQAHGIQADRMRMERVKGDFSLRDGLMCEL